MSVFKRIADCLAAAAAALALAGCAGLAPAPQPAPAQARVYHETIELAGRLSVRYQRDGKDEALHGGFTWRQRPGRIEVQLLSPLGQALAAIEIAPGGAVLTQPGQAPRRAADADELTAAALGWPLPVAGLRYWLQGFGADRAAVPAETELRADGWRIRYVGSEPDARTGAPRPKRIDLERSTPQAGEVAIRIVIDDWQAG